MDLRAQFLGLVFFLFLMSPTNILAQKFGHFNSGNFIESMPERAAADKALNDFQTPLLEQITQKEKTLQERYQQIQRLIVEKKLSQNDIAARQEELRKMQADIQKFSVETQEKIYKKREELFSPILNKVSEAVSAVGKENGFKMIFDTSVYNAILFAADSEDVTALVKQKLGL